MGIKFYSASDPLLPVENPIIGNLYHLSWAKNGCAWVLKEINRDWVRLETPQTKKSRWAKKADLRHTRKSQNKIENNEKSN